MLTDKQVENRAKPYLKIMDENPELDKAWYDYRCNEPSSVGELMEYLPKFVKKWLKKNGKKGK